MWINYALAMLVGTVIFISIYMIRRYYVTKNFLQKISNIIDLYEEHHPTCPENYFDDIIFDLRVIMQNFWILELSNFVIDKEKFNILIEFSKDVVDGKYSEPSNIRCPWCGNSIKDNFKYFEPKSTPKLKGKGALICTNCGASTPLNNSEEECWILLEYKDLKS